MLTYLIRTNSLDSDERFDKTLTFLEDLGEKVTVFGVVKSVSSRADRFVERTLWLRKRFRSGNLVAIKYAELLVRTALFLLGTLGKRRWYANYDFLPLQAITTLFASRANRPIWDLHEMPPGFAIRNHVIRRLFAFLLERSHVIVCNESRRKVLEETFGVALPDALVLRNYPSAATREQLASARRDHLESVPFREDALSVVIIGGDVPGRYVTESIKVIADLRAETGLDITVTLVGGAPLENAPDFVTSTGFLPFRQLVSECVKGRISLCFYRMNSLNNIFCEPNRFYQGLLAGQSVVSFDHPSLQDIVSPLRWIVDEDSFEASLKTTLKALFDGLISANSGEPRGERALDQIFIFESQLPAFQRWLSRPPVAKHLSGAQKP